MTPKELVLATLEFKNPPRVPRQLWLLPWAEQHYPEAVERINADFSWDIGGPAVQYAQPSPVERGIPTEVGEYVDPWGCVFTNIQRGVIGEVKSPLIRTDDWSDVGNIHIPEEQLSFSIEQVNAQCAGNPQFLLSGCCPRPFEQLQFIRGTADLYMDLLDRPAKMVAFMEQMHDFYCRLLTKWAKTDVDALNFMDDWGSQKSLLISPDLWREIFAPMYRDYIDIAHKYGKKIFMHSDGYTKAMLPDLIDMGLDAINTQLFCMGVDTLRTFRGKITFWGEICRQHLLPHGTTQDIDDAVHSIMDNLWDNGGVIAQCEFGPAGNPENVYEVYKEFDRYRF